MSEPRPELTVLTLTLNEADSLGPFVERMRPAISPLDPGFEFLVVDGGSGDGTPELARSLGARVVRQDGPGYGAAYRQGLGEARGRWILTLDADSSHPMELVAEFWRRREGQDLVLGSRYLPGAADTRPAGRRLMSRFLNLAYRSLLRLPYTDISGGFRLYRAEAVQRLPSVARYYDVVAEVFVLLAFAGRRILEIPYRYVPRVHGESKARVIRFGFCYFLTLSKLRRCRPRATA